jgi:hypothetical protein
MNHEARTIFNTTQKQFATNHQRQTFNALIAAFLEADGNPRPEHAPIKSPSAFSRFLNLYNWNARSIIRAVRTAILTQIWAAYAQHQGRRPILEIILDLTTLEKTGVFPNFLLVRQHLTGYSRQLKDKIGLHLVVLYVVFPWSLAVWRGKDTVTPAQLALRLLSYLPVWWSERFTVRVLADSGFDSDEFIDGVHNLGLHGFLALQHLTGLGR